MNRNFIDSYFFLLFSIIPIAIILGPAVSLINILLIDLSFILFLLYKKNYQFLSSKIVKLILLLCLYLIFNSIISQNFSIGAQRNFGFIRFGILFCAFNYFFYYHKSFHKILIVWAASLIILCLDVYIESYLGKNILGYGGVEYGGRLVSFFKDELIVGAYLNTFFLIITGYLFFINKKFLGKYRIIILTISIIFLIGIFLTGERSNSIKALLGFFIFYLICDNFKIKEKFFSIILIFVLLISLFYNSEFVRFRFGEQLVKPIYSMSLRVLNLHSSSEDTNVRESDRLENSIYIQIYKSGFSVFKNYPIFGVGNKNYRLETCNNSEINSFYWCTTHPHQIYFEFLAEHGLFGTIVLLLILFNLVFGKIRMIYDSKNYIQIGCFMFLFTNFIPFLPSGSFFNDTSLTFFWINLSLMYAVNKKTNIFFSK
jgi:O-antigen ligase